MGHPLASLAIAVTLLSACGESPAATSGDTAASTPATDQTATPTIANSVTTLPHTQADLRRAASSWVDAANVGALGSCPVDVNGGRDAMRDHFVSVHPLNYDAVSDFDGEPTSQVELIDDLGIKGYSCGWGTESGYGTEGGLYVFFGPQISTAWVEQNQLIGYNQGTEVFRTAWLPALDGEYLRVLDNGDCFAIWVTPGALVSVYGTSDVSGGDDEELECAAGFDLVLLDHLTEYLTIVS